MLCAVRAIVGVSAPLLASPGAAKFGSVPATSAPAGKPLGAVPFKVTRLWVLPVKVGAAPPALVLAKKSGTVVVAFWPRMQLMSWAVAEPLPGLVLLPPLLLSLKT